MRSLPRPLRRYVAFVCAAGLAALAIQLAEVDWRSLERSPVLWLLIVLLVASEWVPIRVPFRDGAQDVTLSTTFVFALLLSAGTPLAAGAQGVASMLPDLWQRKPWWKTLFNAAQYTLAVSAAGAVLAMLDGRSFARGADLTPRALLVMLVAGAVFFLVNNMLIGTAIAVDQGASLLYYLRSDLSFQAMTAFVLLSQAPLLLLVAERGLWLVPVFFPAIAAAYRSAQVSVQRDHQALHDPLTDLPNRTHFLERVHRALDERPEERFAVLHIDVDDFREVNNTLGHEMGDLLLPQIGARLQDALAETATVARLGGDEFAVLATIADRDAADHLGILVRGVFDEPFDLDGLPIELDASSGVALYPDHGDNAGLLLRRADVAMYAAKERRSGYEIYHEAVDRHDPRRLTLLGELRHALERGQLVLYFQPQASIATGDATGTEALVRWNHPERGLVLPDEFIPLAEATGLIGPLAHFVIDAALAQCRRWRDTGLDLTVAVNLSARNLQDRDLPARVAALLERHGVPASAFEVEVTESAAMADPALAQSVLGRIHDLGVAVSLDDFGTGHSSLAYIKRLPIDTIKVDKSFVLGMLTDDDDATIVASTIELGHSLGLRVVAEGVESEAVWRRLAAYGCDLAQGYYLSRPIPAEKLTTWLAVARGVRPDPGTEVPSAPPALAVVPDDV